MDEETFEDIKQAIKGIKFYEITLMGDSLGTMSMCTYRPQDTVRDLFKKKAGEKSVCMLNCWEHSIDQLVEMPDYFPVFCVELHNMYSDLESLAKDLMVSRISGVIDRDMEGME